MYPDAVAAVLLAPHHDDETLFAAFTIMRERPKVIVVLESHLQEQRGNRLEDALVSDWLRRGETLLAMTELLIPRDRFGLEERGWTPEVEFWPFRDDAPDWRGVEARLRESLAGVTRLIAPASHVGGHEHHNAVADIALEVAYSCGLELVRYTSYVRGDRRVEGEPVPFEPWMVERKLRALACYRSQIHLWPHHFLGDQREYLA